MIKKKTILVRNNKDFINQLIPQLAITGDMKLTKWPIFDTIRDIEARKWTRVYSLPPQPIQSGPCLTQQET